MSGKIIVEAANLMPENVSGLVGVDTLHDLEVGTAERRAKVFDSMRKDFAGTNEKIVRSLFPKGADAALIDRIVKDEVANDPAIAISVLETIGPSTSRLAKFKATIVCVNADPFPTEVAKNRKVAPQYQVRLIAGSGHWPMYDAPEKFDAILDEVVAAMIPPRK